MTDLIAERPAVRRRADGAVARPQPRARAVLGRLLRAARGHAEIEWRWFCTAARVVEWFRSRRSVSFEQIHTTEGLRTRVSHDGTPVAPAFTVRVHHTAGSRDLSWNGATDLAVDSPALVSNS